jgi:hypothetical protein
MNIVKKIEIAVDEFRSTTLLFTDDGYCVEAEKGGDIHKWSFGTPFRATELTTSERKEIDDAIQSCCWQGR